MNNEFNEITFCELRAKEVVNSSDGKKMGKIVDLVFSLQTGMIKGIVTPYNRRSAWGKGQDIFIPWRNIVKIGDDCILVRIYETRGGFLPDYDEQQNDDG